MHSRRQFLRALTAGIVTMTAGGWPLRKAWPLQGAPAGKLRLVFYTDVHTRVEWETPHALEKAAIEINAHTPDIIIAGGDLITDGFEYASRSVAPRWDAYMNMHRMLESEVRPVIGNHDLVAAMPIDGTSPATDPRAIYRAHMGLERTYGSFDAAGYHFIFLDSVHVTYDRLKYEGRINPEQMAWLESDLAGTPSEKPIVVCTHIPLLTSFYMATKGATFAAQRNRVMVNNVEVLSLFEKHNLVLVLQGHLHVNEMIRWKETVFITGGAMCGKWWRGPRAGTEEGFGVITLHNNRVEWEYVDYGWEARRPKNK